MTINLGFSAALTVFVGSEPGGGIDECAVAVLDAAEGGAIEKSGEGANVAVEEGIGGVVVLNNGDGVDIDPEVAEGSCCGAK